MARTRVLNKCIRSTNQEKKTGQKIDRLSYIIKQASTKCYICGCSYFYTAIYHHQKCFGCLHDLQSKISTEVF
jgi:hypothetical protein